MLSETSISFSLDSYRPLPDFLTIKLSTIDGLGLFAANYIPKGHEFGITHIEDSEFENNYIRTPLGGFFNHSDDPNCEAYVHHAYIMLRSIKDIKAGEELTVKYWLYKFSSYGKNKIWALSCLRL